MSLGKISGILLLSLLQIGVSPGMQARSQTSIPSPDNDVILQPIVRPVPCSTQEFNYFFRVFIRGLDDLLPRSAIRNAYVWPQVQVRSYQNPKKLLATVSKQNYDGFRIGLLNNLWIYLDPNIPNYSEAYPRLQIKFKPINRRKIRVDYIQAEYVSVSNETTQGEKLVRTFGEPGAYIFEHRNSCWHLTQELRSMKRPVVQPNL